MSRNRDEIVETFRVCDENCSDLLSDETLAACRCVIIAFRVVVTKKKYHYLIEYVVAELVFC